MHVLKEFGDLKLDDKEYDSCISIISLYYTCLDLEMNCSKDEIKKQYKILALKNHPDRGGDNIKMTKINEAYEKLTDDSFRQQYDKKINTIKRCIPIIRHIITIYSVSKLLLTCFMYYGIGYSINLIIPFNSITYAFGFFIGKKLLLK